MGFRKSTGPSNKDLEKMFENISSGFESSTIPSKLDSQNQNNLASLVQGLQHEDALKEEIEQLEEERKKLKEETKPFWKVYSSFKHNILNHIRDKKALEPIINDFFTTTFHPKDLTKSFDEIDKGLDDIKSSRLYPKKEEENIDEKTLIKYIIKTNTTIGKQFFERFIEKIWAVVRNIDPIKSPKEQIIEELNKNNKTSQSETQSDDKSKENHKRFIDTINQNLVEIEDIFLTKLADLYLDSQDQQK